MLTVYPKKKVMNFRSNTAESSGEVKGVRERSKVGASKRSAEGTLSLQLKVCKSVKS